jgi:hypothetical protein
VKANEVKGRIAEPEEAAISQQQLSKQAFVAADTDATVEEPKKVVFSMQFMPRLY